MTVSRPDLAGEDTDTTPTDVPGKGTETTWEAPVQRRTTPFLVFGVMTVSLVPRLLTVGNFWTVDEQNWMRRSSTFSNALTDGRFSDMSASGPGNPLTGTTMPGATTMWLGSAARGVWEVGRSMAWWSSTDTEFRHSHAGLAIAQSLMALTVSLLLGLLVFLLVQWIGTRAAMIAGLLMATEPFFVSLGSMLHTDGLLTVFGVSGLVAAALVLGIPHATACVGKRRYAVLSGVLLAGAVLTKLLALVFLISAGGLFIWAAGRTWLAGRRADRSTSTTEGADNPTVLSRRQLTRLSGSAIVAGLAITAFSYPALLVDPLDELGELSNSMRIAGSHTPGLFLGEVRQVAGPLYLFVTIPFRVTPWFLLTSMAAFLGLALRRQTQGLLVAALIMAGPCFLTVTLVSKQTTRYALPVLAIAAVLLGAGVDRGLRWLTDRHRRFSPGVPWTIASAAGFLVLHTIVVAPWGNAYFNPLLGGGKVAQNTFQLGSGEGLEQAGEIIHEAAGDRCGEIEIWTYPVWEAFPCGDITYRSRRTDVEYAVVYVGSRQRESPEFLDDLIADRELIGTVVIRGTTYAEVYGPRSGGAGPG